MQNVQGTIGRWKKEKIVKTSFLPGGHFMNFDYVTK